MARTRVLLADDHTILRSGLRLLVNNQPDLEVVGEASDGVEVLSLAHDLQPDVILMDLSMPRLDGLGALPLLKKQAPNSRILILTMHEDVSYLREALKAGASGYVLKKVVDNELLQAIRAVMRGETYIHSSITQKLLDDLTPTPKSSQGESDPWASLSERELDVLRLVALGYTNAEIASELSLSTKTVETYRARGMEKLNFETRAQLVRAALERGLLD